MADTIVEELIGLLGEIEIIDFPLVTRLDAYDYFLSGVFEDIKNRGITYIRDKACSMICESVFQDRIFADHTTSFYNDVRTSILDHKEIYGIRWFSSISDFQINKVYWRFYRIMNSSSNYKLAFHSIHSDSFHAIVVAE